MASFNHCIEKVRQTGRISKDVAQRLQSAEDVDQELSNIVANLSRQKREAIIQSTRMSSAWAKASGHSKDPLTGIQSLLSRDGSGQAGYANVELLAKNYQAQYQSDVVDMLQHFRTRALGFYQNEKDLQKLVRAIYGETVDDPDIAAFAKDWHKLNERMRQDFNEKGGSISKNERYLMPQHHDVRSIIKLGKRGAFKGVDLDVAKSKWKEKILPGLDRQQMLDDAGNPLSDNQLDEALDYSFESIITNGNNKSQDFAVPQLGKKLSRKHSDRRFLYFKDADSWMAYQREFGRGDIFTTLTDHIDTMSHDIAMMEVFGPSPESTFKALMGMAEKQMPSMPPKRKAYTKMLYNVVSGKVNGGDMLSVADFGQLTTNILVASTLGKAFISAISDVGFQAITSRYRGLPVFRSIGNQLRLMTSEEMQVFAAKTGLMADGMINRFHAANRYADFMAAGKSGKVAEAVMRGSLLEPWTNAGRWGWGMSFQAELAENFGKRFSELDDRLLRAFREYGIEEADWDAFRRTATANFKGVQYADLTHKEARKFSMMVLGEADYAVPTPDARVRAITTLGTERASIEGQLWRSGMMLKSFPIGLYMTHLQRAAYQATLGDKLSYFGMLLATTTVLGGIAVLMKDLAAGRDPREVFDGEGIPVFDDQFIMAALMQGGGLGIFGDLVFSDYTRFGQSFTETVLGPKFQMANDTAKLMQLTAGGIGDAISNEEINVLGDFVQYTDRYTPDIWQTHLIMNSMFDQLEILADPKAAQKFHRQVRKRKKEYDQDYWWRPGRIKPDRPPDFSEIAD